MNRRRQDGAALPHQSDASVLAQEVVEAIVAERERFHRFLTARVGSEADADDLLQESVLRALTRSERVRRGERSVAWFYRILRNAVADHYRRQQSHRRRADSLAREFETQDDNVAPPDAAWEGAVCRCLGGLLPALPPRYAEVLQRVDLDREPKPAVAESMNVSRGTLDVLLHRARQALRQQLEIFCGACSRESCLTCACETRERRKKSV